MAMSAKEIIRWLQTLDSEQQTVAIDDGGLTLVALDEKAAPGAVSAYLEVGGVPEEEDEDDNDGGGIWTDEYSIVKNGSKFDVLRYRSDLETFSRYAEFETKAEAEQYVDCCNPPVTDEERSNGPKRG